MAFDQSLIDDILKHADIVRVVSSYLNLTKKGKNFLAVCPFHDDSNPSLTISPEKQIFKCFVCGTSGNAITFVQKYEHLTFMEAMKKVADLSDYHPDFLSSFAKEEHVDERKKTILKCLKDLTTYYQYALNTEEGKAGLEYFESRHLDSEMRNKYMLGYAFNDGRSNCQYLLNKGHSLKTIEDTGIALANSGSCVDKNQGRVIFPIADQDGNIIGYSARRIKDNDEAKYVNSPETYVFNKSSVLYNYHIAKSASKLKGYIYVLEGFMDVFALSRIGIDAAVALMGTALTSEHISMLRKLNVEIRLCLDGDLPGQKAMMKCAKMFDEAGLNYRIVDNQGSSKDPDEILNDDGPEALKNYLDNLINRIDFSLNFYLRNNQLSTNKDKKDLIINFLPILLNVKSRLEFDNYVHKLSKITGFDSESITSLVNRSRQSNKDEISKQIQNFHPERKLMRRLQLAEREVLFQMLNNKYAIQFYEEKITGFYDEIYRSIANFVIEYAEKHDDIDASGLISNIEASGINNKDELINELSTLILEKNHPNTCDDVYLNNLLASISDEKEKIFEKDILSSSLEGKDPLEQARIIADYNARRKSKLH